MHSLAGLIHADYRAPALDYDMVLRVVLALTRNIADVERTYALACVNVLAHNRDDHARNFPFLLNERNEWVFAPAYDLTFANGPAGEQSTLAMGEAGNPRAGHLKALGNEHSLRKARAILARVQDLQASVMAATP
jgi:serine/threonine-protein kinase HipA